MRNSKINLSTTLRIDGERSRTIKSQKLLIITFLVPLFLSLIPVQIQAGLVPCGPGTAKPTCEFCDLFVLLDNFIDFFFIKIVLPVATLMIVIGGIMFFVAAGNPQKITTAKSILTSVAIGLFLIFGAWLILGLFFQAIGLADWTKNIYQNWWQKGFFEIPCQ
jgi:hypothetical protein